MGCQLYECKYNDNELCMLSRSDNEKCSCETKVKAPMLRFILDGCDISYAAEAPADMTLAQLLKQCDRIHPDYCACGIRSTDDKPELIFGYDSVNYIRGETGYAACSIDGVNPPECQHCKYLEETYEASEYEFADRCGNKNSRFYGCLRDPRDTCELQEDEDGTSASCRRTKMEPQCKKCYYFLETIDADNSEHDYYCLGDNYPYATPADIKGCRFWDKNVCFKEMEDENASKS